MMMYKAILNTVQGHTNLYYIGKVGHLTRDDWVLIESEDGVSVRMLSYTNSVEQAVTKFEKGLGFVPDKVVIVGNGFYFNITGFRHPYEFSYYYVTVDGK